MRVLWRKFFLFIYISGVDEESINFIHTTNIKKSNRSRAWCRKLKVYSFANKGHFCTLLLLPISFSPLPSTAFPKNISAKKRWVIDCEHPFSAPSTEIPSISRQRQKKSIYQFEIMKERGRFVIWKMLQFISDNASRRALKEAVLIINVCLWRNRQD